MNAHLHHPLLRIAVAAALATAITWLGGLLFGPVSEARARQLAQDIASPGPRVAARAISSIEGTQSRGAAPRPSDLAS